MLHAVVNVIAIVGEDSIALKRIRVVCIVPWRRRFGLSVGQFCGYYDGLLVGSNVPVGRNAHLSEVLKIEEFLFTVSADVVLFGWFCLQ